MTNLVSYSSSDHATQKSHLRFGQMAILAGGGAHLFLGVLFALLGVYALALFNVGSVILFTFSYRAMNSGRTGLAVAFGWFEVISHAIAASVVLGWDTGFHLYLLLLAPMAFSNANATFLRKVSLASALVVIYYVLDAALRSVPPCVALQDEWVSLFRRANVAGLIFGLSYVMHWFAVTSRSVELQLIRLATVDPLTGLSNRRHMHQLANGTVERSRQASDIFSVLVIDVDHFKKVNDQHGHATGDAVLEALAMSLRHGVRERDAVARWGGEEFLVLLPSTPVEAARNLAARLETAIRQIRIEALQSGVSCTIGVAAWDGRESFDDCVRRADSALYRGKAGGRARIEVAA